MQNFCSKCYQDLCLKNSGDSSSTSIFPAPLTGAPSPSPPAVVHHAAPVVVSLPPEKVEIQAEVAQAAPQPKPTATVFLREKVDIQAALQPKPTVENRCSTCRKKVGLTGFRCRCGVMFCGTHRYPKKHGCTFDFKLMG